MGQSCQGGLFSQHLSYPSLSQWLWLAFKSRHSLIANIYRGRHGYTRVQSVQIVANSVTLELLVLVILFTLPTP